MIHVNLSLLISERPCRYADIKVRIKCSRCAKKNISFNLSQLGNENEVMLHKTCNLSSVCGF